MLILFAANAPQVLAQSEAIYGVFKQCPFGCRFIKINRDFTFEQLLDGDLYNNQRTKGTWKLIGKNKIKAEGAKTSGEPQVKETSENRNNFFITVVDPAGAVIPNAKISGEASGKSFKCVTTEDGSCEIPKTEKFDIAFASYRGTHKVKDIRADVFRVLLMADQIEPTIDEVWLIENNRLFVADSDGSFDRNDGYEKLSQKRAKKLFP